MVLVKVVVFAHPYPGVSLGLLITLFSGNCVLLAKKMLNPIPSQKLGRVTVQVLPLVGAKIMQLPRVLQSYMTVHYFVMH